MSKKIEDARERLFAKAAVIAECGNGSARVIGRLLSSNVTDAMSDFLNNEQRAKTDAVEVMGAVTWYAASVLSAFLIHAPAPARKPMLDALAASLSEFALEMIETAEAKDGT